MFLAEHFTSFKWNYRVRQSLKRHEILIGVERGENKKSMENMMDMKLAQWCKSISLASLHNNIWQQNDKKGMQSELMNIFMSLCKLIKWKKKKIKNHVNKV